MNPAVIAKKTSVTATNMRSPIATTCFDVAITAPRSEAFRLHESVEEVDEEAEGAEAGQSGHEGAGHEQACMIEEFRWPREAGGAAAPLACRMACGEATANGMSMRIDSIPKWWKPDAALIDLM
ncbi:hypothetical protein [Sphingomonas sp. TX0522]|uniref:hypothetical protein n=1 Tax=Sphingomonas sp. TX0522 TaxID=2479205 RepID=UPI001E4A3DF0|nr:hypothetical protein [Sphingomonas sp. TX0522]